MIRTDLLGQRSDRSYLMFPADPRFTYVTEFVMFDLLSFDEHPNFYNSGRAGVAEWGQLLRTWRRCSNGTELMGIGHCCMAG